MELFNVYPINNITITRAIGSRVWDDLKTEYLDMYGGHAVISIGHQHPHWVNSIKQQLDKISFYSNSIKIPLQNVLAEKLGEVSGKKDFSLFLCNSGAEANENALKLASFHTSRKKIIAFKKSFHGRTSLAVAATDNPSIIAPVNETDNIIFLPFNDEEALTHCFAEEGNNIAAVIVEGIQGVGGIHIASNGFLQAIRRCCDEFGSIYIADSVQCGYGRSGMFFSHDYAGVNADIYTMAKGMGNGFPIGGIIISPKIQAKHFMLGTTFGGNHLACAAAIAVLEVIEAEQLIQHAKKIGDHLMNELKAIPEMNNVRGLGLMIGFDVPDELKQLKSILLQEYKIFTGEAKPNVIRLLPSLALTMEDAEIFIASLKKAIAQLQS